MSYIAFNDKIPYQMLYAAEDTGYITSHHDVEPGANRKILSIHFDAGIVPPEAVEKYYLNADEETTVITIVDDAGNPFIHTDYCIPVRLGREMYGDDPNPHTILTLARLTPKDKLLRILSGKTKVYTGTPLHIAIEKKVDEMSEECTQNIYNGIDIPVNGVVKHFTFDAKDQTDITGLGLEMLMQSNLIMWHDDIEEEDCEVYSYEEMRIILGLLSLHRKYNISYFRNLRRYLRSIEGGTEEDAVKFSKVDSVWYGMDLPEAFKSNTYNLIVSEMGDFFEVEKATMKPAPNLEELNQAILDQQRKWAEENGLIPVIDTSTIDNNEVTPDISVTDENANDNETPEEEE